MNVTRKDATITNTDDTFPGSFEVILSAPTKDRDGDTLLPEEWKQPLPDHITFDADHGMSVASTVGSGVPRIDEETGNLIVSGTYSSLPRAQEVRTLVNEGHIRTTSVAFMTEPSETKDGKPGPKVRELLNGAFVAIPSNREALVLSSKSAIPTPAEIFGKAGARNSKSDMAHIQAIHDHALALGAMPADSTGAALEAMGGKSAAGTVYVDVKPRFDSFKDAQRLIAQAREQFPDEPGLKSIAGSLEAQQDRVRDALQDAYPDKYVWLRGTLPDAVVFELCDIDGPECETYRQTYTDDGSAVTLTGEAVAVDLAEVVVPDPDADREPDEAAPAEKSAEDAEIALKLQALRIEVAAAAPNEQ